MYLLINLFAFSIALSLMDISTFSLRMSSLSESDSTINSIVVGGGDGDDGLGGYIVTSVVTSDLDVGIWLGVDAVWSMMEKVL